MDLNEKELPAFEPQLQSLKKWNWAMFALHAVQGGLMLTISSSFSLPVVTNYLMFNPVWNRLQPAMETVVNLKIGPMIAAFLFLSALAHLANALGFRRYSANLMKGVNPMRWVEYAFSSSLMIVVIALLVGIYDVVSLLGLFGLNAMMILFGWMMELHNQALSSEALAKGETTKTNWTAFWFGSLAGIIPWIGIALYLFSAGDATHHAPTFVYWIYLSMFLFFNCFAINMVLQYKKVGKWQDYLYGERAYMILSLVAKSLLAWQVFAGTLRPV